MRDKFDAECSAIEQNCTYTAETHHIIAAKRKRVGNFFQIAPAVIAAVLGGIAAANLATAAVSWVLTPVTQWLSVIAAAIAAVSNYINPLAEYSDHLAAAKGFTILKQDARSLRETFSAPMSDDAYVAEVRALHERYADLVRSSPETDNISFEAAREKIKRGIHELD
jgi:hypothetical protein